MDKIRLFHNLARSGGTIVSRCIGCMNDVELLSEIHPDPRAQAIKGFSIITQARDWHRLTLPAQLNENLPFAYKTRVINDYCIDNNKYLVLRDWAHVDFFGPPVASNATGFFSLNSVLSQDFELITCALVRHPLDMWLSVGRMKIFVQNNINIRAFLRGYKSFIEAIGDSPIIKYESFTVAPEKALDQICEDLELPYDQDFLSKWYKHKLLTGDMKKVSRAGGGDEIKVIPRRPVSSELNVAIKQDPAYHWILERLDYVHEESQMWQMLG